MSAPGGCCGPGVAVTATAGAAGGVSAVDVVVGSGCVVAVCATGSVPCSVVVIIGIVDASDASSARTTDKGILNKDTTSPSASMPEPTFVRMYAMPASLYSLIT